MAVNTYFLRLPIAFSLLCFALLGIRTLVSHSFHYWFLGWNLVLALIPMVIAQMMYKSHRKRKTNPFFWGMVIIWLLFLPNCQYMVTDLVHLKNDGSLLSWYDLFLIFVFALTGMVSGLVSMLILYDMLLSRIRRRVVFLLFIPISYLCGLGIYMGRFLRFNSWEALTKPTELAVLFLEKVEPGAATMVTLVMGSCIYLLFHSVVWSIKVARANSIDGTFS